MGILAYQFARDVREPGIRQSRETQQAIRAVSVESVSASFLLDLNKTEHLLAEFAEDGNLLSLRFGCGPGISGMDHGYA
jgi:hypothetical protein